MNSSSPDHSSPDTSSELLRGLRVGAAVDWQRLVTLHAPVMHRICRHHGLQSADADDVVQQTLADVQRGLDRFERRGAGSFRGWMYEILRRRIADYWRRRAGQPDAAGGSGPL